MYSAACWLEAMGNMSTFTHVRFSCSRNSIKALRANQIWIQEGVKQCQGRYSKKEHITHRSFLKCNAVRDGESNSLHYFEMGTDKNFAILIVVLIGSTFRGSPPSLSSISKTLHKCKLILEVLPLFAVISVGVITQKCIVLDITQNT